MVDDDLFWALAAANRRLAVSCGLLTKIWREMGWNVCLSARKECAVENDPMEPDGGRTDLQLEKISSFHRPSSNHDISRQKPSASAI